MPNLIEDIKKAEKLISKEQQYIKKFGLEQVRRLGPSNVGVTAKAILDILYRTPTELNQHKVKIRKLIESHICTLTNGKIYYALNHTNHGFEWELLRFGVLNDLGYNANDSAMDNFLDVSLKKYGIPIEKQNEFFPEERHRNWLVKPHTTEQHGHIYLANTIAELYQKKYDSNPFQKEMTDSLITIANEADFLPTIKALAALCYFNIKEAKPFLIRKVDTINDLIKAGNFGKLNEHDIQLKRESISLVLPYL